MEKEIDSLIYKGRSLLKSQKYNEAIKCLTEADSIVSKASKKFESRLPFIYNIRGNVESDLLRFELAVDFFKKSLYYSQKLEIDTISAKNLLNLGFNYYRLDQFKLSEKYYSLYIDLTKKIYSDTSLKYKKALNNTSFFYASMGYHEKALQMIDEANSYFKIYYDTLTSDFINALNNFGLSYMQLGLYSKSEDLFKRAVHILDRNHLKIEQIRHAGLVINLGIALTYSNKYSEALYYYQVAESLFQDSIKNFNHPHYFQLLKGKAKVYRNTGNLEKLQELLTEQNNIYLSIHSVNSASYGLFLLDRARYGLMTHQLDGVDSMFLKALDIFKMNFKPFHQNYCKALMGLANYYSLVNNLDLAFKNLFELRDSLESHKMSGELIYANLLSNIGEKYIKTNDYENAEKVLLKAVQIYKLGKVENNNDYITTLHNLSKVYFKTKNYQNSIILQSEILTWNQNVITNSSQLFSENELGNFINVFQEQTNLNYLLSALTNDSITVQTSVNQSLFLKGYLLNQYLKKRNAIDRDSKLETAFNSLNSVKDRILKLESSNNIDTTLYRYLHSKSDSLQHYISHHSFLIENLNTEIKWQDLKSAIGKDEVILEFVTYNKNENVGSDSIYYAAMLISKTISKPLFLDLFAEAELKNIFAKISSRRLEGLSYLYSTHPNIKRGDLYTLVWEKLEPYLSGIKTIHYSPTGFLHSINMESIQFPDKLYVRNKHRLLLHQSSTKVVQHYSDNTKSGTLDFALFGGINYDADLNASIQNQDLIASNEGKLQANADLFRKDTGVINFNWKYLKGSENEVKSISKLVILSNNKSNVYTDHFASELEFKSLSKSLTRPKSPDVIHLSTHAYFYEDATVDTANNKVPDIYIADLQVKSSSKINSEFDDIIIQNHSDPMKCAGIILSGANKANRNRNQFNQDREDGILTAYEISLMDLSDTKLVVLSACETGLGKIDNNEGVYGLQRAFKIAGVKNVIMSLWQIPDKQTAELMELFYKNWLINKMTSRDALQAAQSVMQDKKYEPYYWAGFVLMD
ncbi:MAG: CHAT domain-containing protein [Saprospiraceae bacterium]|nr:CHAT domain-containing protein [Saprospiraceae bacterium]